MKTFPTLYKKTSTGAQQEWTIRVEADKIITRFGQAGGTIQETQPTICVGKNIGKTNETSAEQQALLEAQSQWEKKLKKDYALTAKDAMAGKASSLVEGGVLPMLAHKFSEHGDKLVYPCAVQPKLDGHRCIGMRDGLWSRTRKLITGVPHIGNTLKNILGKIPLDGELYNHAYHDKFEELTHFIRQETPTPGHEIVEYHVYDCVMPGGFGARLAYLKALLTKGEWGSVRLVETRIVNDEDELMLAFEDFLAQGYEGAIARDLDGVYVNRRSYDLLKIKKFDDAEFKCVGVEEGKGKMAGHAVFVCVTKSGTEFKAKMKGDHDALVKYFEKPALVVGKQLTIKYQGLTNKNGVPRFPVCTRICTAL